MGAGCRYHTYVWLLNWVIRTKGFELFLDKYDKYGKNLKIKCLFQYDRSGTERTVTHGSANPWLIAMKSLQDYHRLLNDYFDTRIKWTLDEDAKIP